jgi:D-alanyl-D-alanine carboxypeptidase
MQGLMRKRRKKFPKFVALGVLAGALFVGGLMHPSIFISGNVATSTVAVTMPTTTPEEPVLALPALSASSGAGSAQGAVSSSAPAIGAVEILIADLTTGQVSYQKNSTERWALASISKLMTAVVASDLLDANQHITITESMMAIDPSQRIMQLGDTYTASDLLHILLLPSNNVAAEAFAQFSGRATFLDAMNKKAQEWGMVNTYYDDPSGLSAANQSSAHDLLLLAQHVYTEYPQLLAMTRLRQVNVTAINTGRVVIVPNINHFAGNPEFLGGKTGYTFEANGNLLSIFSYRSKPILFVVLGTTSGDRFADTSKLLKWYKANN